ncbi:hypothetical protein PC118_g4491 [Phytophthora cactorum]|uniref:Uncharacterized protein n=1 Tax=Phytophthora cactorum TaxID=29920 RepID=A0A8T1GED1_9STRA|nr:hypothetical protein PC118_g4491 [Phytophthora cactorum]
MSTIGLKPAGRPRKFGESLHPLTTKFRFQCGHCDGCYGGWYLKKKVANLNRRNFPVRPEVFLDETFCNFHHVAQLSWVDEDKVRFSKSDRGPRFCIVAAGIIRRENNGIVGELIEESREVWQSNLKRKHDDDYHGNFSTEQFERWFENLCAHLAIKYGPCNIQLDGARYHKSQTNSAPNSRALKDDIQA